MYFLHIYQPQTDILVKVTSHSIVYQYLWPEIYQPVLILTPRHIDTGREDRQASPLTEEVGEGQQEQVSGIY